jgi:glycosyltransferase involved in cell wall biosynthesis
MIPKVSIIIATYNQAQYLAKAIESVLAQTYTDFELIIVDDGSTDSTQEIVAGFQDRRIRYHWQVNQERCAARNKGISISQGDYITFLDGDDCYLKEKLSCQVPALDKNPDIGMVVSGWIRTDDYLNPIDEKLPWHQFPTPILQDWLFNGLTIIGANLIRREYLERMGGFDLDLKAGEDTYLWFELARMGCNTLWVKEKTMMQRVHANNTTRDVTRMFEANLILINKVFSTNEYKYDFTEHESYAKVYLNAALRYYGINDPKQGCSNLSKAIQYDPTLIENGGEKILVNLFSYANDPKNPDPECYINNFLSNLPDQLLCMNWNKNKIKAGVWIDKGFTAYQLGRTDDVRYLFLKALSIYPGWAMNRGVVSLLFEGLVGQSLTNRLRIRKNHR